MARLHRRRRAAEHISVRPNELDARLVQRAEGLAVAIGVGGVGAAPEKAATCLPSRCDSAPTSAAAAAHVHGAIGAAVGASGGGPAGAAPSPAAHAAASLGEGRRELIAQLRRRRLRRRRARRRRATLLLRSGGAFGRLG